MIKRNLGNAERIIRLLVGIGLFAWILSRPGVNGMEIFIGVIATALVLNGVFCRCYLWYVLDIDTAEDDADDDKRGRPSAAC